MQTMGISKFKSHALRILDQVARTKEIVVVTKHGRPLAQIVPYRDSSSNHVPGKLADALVFEDDILSPLDEDMWDAAK